MNHELWVICPHCGKEYDWRLHYDNCPFCKKNIKNIDMNPENKEKAKKLFSQLDTLEYYKRVWEEATKFRVPMVELDSPNTDEYPNVPLNLISFDILKKNYLYVINKKIEALNQEIEQL